jgi:hypothetical protein
MKTTKRKPKPRRLPAQGGGAPVPEFLKQMVVKSKKLMH